MQGEAELPRACGARSATGIDYLVGQRGSGKTGVYQQVAKTLAAPVVERHPFRTLALVPPHLLDTWRDESSP